MQRYDNKKNLEMKVYKFFLLKNIFFFKYQTRFLDSMLHSIHYILVNFV